MSEDRIAIVEAPRPSGKAAEDAAYLDAICHGLGETAARHFRDHEYVECDSCRNKPGSPTLCAGCLANRKTVGDLRAALKEALNGWAQWLMVARASRAMAERFMPGSPMLGPDPTAQYDAVDDRVIELRKLMP